MVELQEHIFHIKVGGFPGEVAGKMTFFSFFWLSNAYLPHIMKSGMKENEAGYCRNFLCMDLGGQSLSGGFAVKVNSGASLALHNEKLKQLEASGKSGCGTPAAWGPSAATFIPVFLLTI